MQNWEEIESLKNEKVLEKSWSSVFLFPYEPCIMFGSMERTVLYVNCAIKGQFYKKIIVKIGTVLYIKNLCYNKSLSSGPVFMTHN